MIYCRVAPGIFTDPGGEPTSFRPSSLCRRRSDVADEKQKCFVLMPFEPPREKYYSQIYSRAIEEAGLAAKRGDSLFRSSPIMGDIWKFVQESTVLLADLTGRNANVFYELGLAHAISKPVVLVAETMDDVPFDLRGLRVLTFDRNDPDWGATLRERIALALKETLADILGSVPSMFIQTTPRVPARPEESALASEVRTLREEITALRRESRRTVRKQPKAGELSVAGFSIDFREPRPSHKLVIDRIQSHTGGTVIEFRESPGGGEAFFQLETPRAFDVDELLEMTETLANELNANVVHPDFEHS
jgi:hypothetical protein